MEEIKDAIIALSKIGKIKVEINTYLTFPQNQVILRAFFSMEGSTNVHSLDELDSKTNLREVHFPKFLNTSSSYPLIFIQKRNFRTKHLYFSFVNRQII